MVHEKAVSKACVADAFSRGKEIERIVANTTTKNNLFDLNNFLDNLSQSPKITINKHKLLILFKGMRNQRIIRR